MGGKEEKKEERKSCERSDRLSRSSHFFSAFFSILLCSMTSFEAMAVDAPGPLPLRLRLVAELSGHEGRCWGVDWSPEGEEREKRERKRAISVLSTPVTLTLLLSPSRNLNPDLLSKNKTGDTLASCGADRTVRTWHQLRIRSKGNESGGRWAPDAVLEESQARAVRAVAWAPPPPPPSSFSCSSSPSTFSSSKRNRRRRRRLAAASFDASVAVWEEERPVASGGWNGNGNGNNGDGMENGNDENDLDDDDDDDEPTLWSQVALLQGHESEVKGVAWSPQPGVEAGGESSSSSEDEGEKEEKEVRGERGAKPPSSSSYPPLLADGEGCLLATCGRDRSVWLWESVPSPSSAGNGGSGAGAASACEFECVDVKQGHSGDVKSVTWHPSGSVLASCSYDGAVRLWLPEGGASEEGAAGGGGGGGGKNTGVVVGDEWLCGQEVKDAHGGETVSSFCFEPRRRLKSSKGSTGKSKRVRAASCGGDGRVSVWSCPLPLSAEPATETLSWRAGAVARSAGPPPLGGKVRPAYSVDWSPCGKWIASGGGDDFVRVFRAPGAKEEEEEKEGGGEEEETVLELAAETRPLPPSEVNCVKWRPRRRNKNEAPMLAAACDDGVVRLWRLMEEGDE